MTKSSIFMLAAIFLAAPASAQSINDVLRTVSRVANGAAAVPQRTRTTAPMDRAAPVDARIANGRVAGFDIAGVRLGFTPEQALAQASRAGFQHERTSNSKSFAARRLEALRARRPNFPGSRPVEVVREQFFKGPQGEGLSIEYAAMPEGPRVEKITYGFDPSKIDQRDLERTIFKKFGSPNGRATMVGDSLWCDHRCQEGEATAGYAPNVFHLLGINGSVPAQDFIAALIKTDVERLTPKGRSGI